jgi:hypothetical protein
VSAQTSNEQIRQVKRLLARGISQREAARRCEVSKGCVWKIARGLLRAKRRASRPPVIPPSGPFVRCGHCGRLVQMPCLVKQLEERSLPISREMCPAPPC